VEIIVRGISRAACCFKFGEHHIEAACQQTRTFNQRTETGGFLAVGLARFDWSRQGRMVGGDGVGRYRPLSMALD
jgi:hypothetical protein